MHTERITNVACYHVLNSIGKHRGADFCFIRLKKISGVATRHKPYAVPLLNTLDTEEIQTTLNLALPHSRRTLGWRSARSFNSKLFRRLAHCSHDPHNKKTQK
jgi:hypothetical protein